LLGRLRVVERAPRRDELRRWARLEHLAVDERRRAVARETEVRRARLERRLDAAAVEVLLRELRLRDRGPDPLGRRANEDGVHLRCLCGHGRHPASSSSVLRSASAAARRSVYLSIHRSWISRIGTGLRKWSFSRPCRRGTTSPASSSTRRCFITPKRVMASRSTMLVSAIRTQRTGRLKPRPASSRCRSRSIWSGTSTSRQVRTCRAQSCLTCDRMVTYHPDMDDDRVFRALADPTRRHLLDRLFQRDGRTLTELESELAMTRFGVMKHLRVLEDAGLVVPRRQGREKLHFLN